MITGLQRMAATLLLATASFAFANTAPVTSAEATAIVTAYGEALRNGNLNALRNLAGGALLRKRANLWNTSGYNQLLIDHYGNTAVSIQRLKLDRKGRAVALVTFQSQDDTRAKQLTIARIGNQIRIIDERSDEANEVPGLSDNHDPTRSGSKII